MRQRLQRLRSWQWRTCYRQKSARIAVGIALVAVIAAAVFTSGTFITHAFQHNSSVVHKESSRNDDPRAAGKWFQLSHFGKSHPTANARINALQQAKALPRSSLGVSPLKANAARAQGANANLATAGGSSWAPLGPQPINSDANPTYANGYGQNSGRITAEAVNPTNANDIWVGAADGGLWHSSDGGNTWSPVTDNQPTLSIGAIAIDPHNANTIYVGTGEANLNADAYWGVGILKSTDGGHTWTQYGLSDFGGLGIAKIAVDPNNSSNVLVAAAFDGFTAPPGGSTLYSDMGIWRSTDGGQSWSIVKKNSANSASGFDAGTDVVFDPHNAGVAYAGLGNQFGVNFSSIAGIYKSTNSGANWTQITTAPTGVNIERVSVGISSSGANMYAVLTDASVTDGGTFGALYNSSIYSSTTSGANWTANNVSSVTGPMATDDGEYQWWYDTYAAVDPTDSTGNTAYVGGVDVWQTKNGGSSWTNLTNAYNAGTVHPDQHAFVFKPGSSSYYIGNDGGVWSGDSSGSFTNLNAGGLNITQFYGGSIGEQGSNAQLYGGAQDNGENQYPGAVNNTSAAAQWNEVFGGDGFYTAVDYTNNANVYEEYYYLNINKTTDGGATWNPATNGINANDPVNFSAPFIMSPSNPNVLLAGTDQIYKTVNGAASWSSISPAFDGGSPVSAIAMAASNSNYIYAGDNFGDVFVTTNGGSNWNTDTNFFCQFSMVTGLAVDPTNPSVAYTTCAGFASGSGQHVFKTTNAGSSWTDISSSLPNIPFESVVVSPVNHNLVIAGSDAGIFVSQNAGSSWAQLGTGLPNVAVDQIFFNHTGSSLFVATHGRGMWELDLPHLQAPQAISAVTAPSTNAATQTFTLQNTGLYPLNWSSSGLPSWATITPASGTLQAGASQTVTMTFNTASYTTPQTLTGSMTLTVPNADDSTITVPITVVVTPGQKTWYFAEGYTGGSTSEYLTLENPNSVTANVTVQYLIQGSTTPVTKIYPVSAHSRLTKSVNREIGPGHSVSMVVTGDQPIVAERPMYFTVTLPGDSYPVPGGSDIIGATSLSQDFDFAYLDTRQGYDSWLTILNQNTTPMQVTVTYYAANGAAFIQNKTVDPQSRGSIRVSTDAGLQPGTYSATVHLSENGLVERVLYVGDSSLKVTGGAAVVGVANPLPMWYFAEGNNTPPPPGFDEEYVVSNPSTTLTTDATVTYYLQDGTTKTASTTLGPGQQQIMQASTTLGTTQSVSNSATVTSSNSSDPILAERVELFRFGGTIPGVTDVLGAASPGYLFDFAEGSTAGRYSEYLTLENPSQTLTALVAITVYPDNGGAPTTVYQQVNPHSRSTVKLNNVLIGSFSMQVLSNVPIVAERPMYFDFGSGAGITGGTDVVGYQPAGSTP